MGLWERAERDTLDDFVASGPVRSVLRRDARMPVEGEWRQLPPTELDHAKLLFNPRRYLALAHKACDCCMRRVLDMRSTRPFRCPVLAGAETLAVKRASAAARAICWLEGADGFIR